MDVVDNMYAEVLNNVHTTFVVVNEGGGTITIYHGAIGIGTMYESDGCILVDFYGGKAELLYIDKCLNKHHEFIGDNGFSIKVVNLKDGPYLYLLKDDECFEKPVKTSVLTFEEDIEKVWNYYINESYLIYVEKRQI